MAHKERKQLSKTSSLDETNSEALYFCQIQTPVFIFHLPSLFGSNTYIPFSYLNAAFLVISHSKDA